MRLYIINGYEGPGGYGEYVFGVVAKNKSRAIELYLNFKKSSCITTYEVVTSYKVDRKTESVICFGGHIE